MIHAVRVEADSSNCSRWAYGNTNGTLPRARAGAWSVEGDNLGQGGEVQVSKRAVRARCADTAGVEAARFTAGAGVAGLCPVPAKKIQLRRARAAGAVSVERFRATIGMRRFFRPSAKSTSF